MTGRSRNRLGGLTLYLTEADVDSLLTPADALAAVESCFERMARDAVDNRPRFRHRLESGAFAVMSAVDHELQRAGTKSYSALAPEQAFIMVTLFKRSSRSCRL